MASFENIFASSSSDTVQGSVSFNTHDSLIRTATMAVSYGMGLVEYRVSCETELSVGLYRHSKHSSRDSSQTADLPLGHCQSPSLTLSE